MPDRGTSEQYPYLGSGRTVGTSIFRGTPRGRGDAIRAPYVPPQNGPRNAAQDYLAQLMKRNEEGIASARVTGSGTSSRAYANTQGAQKDMLPTAEIQSRYDAANAGSPGSSSNGVGSGGIGGMGASPEIDPMSLLPTRTDLGSLYDELVKKLTGYGDDINRDFSASEKFIRDQYDRSNVGLTGNFTNANKNLELAKAGLGYGDTSSYQQNMNSITENADLSETADLAYLEKMRGARGIEMKDILTKVQSDRIAQQNAQDLALQEATLEMIAARSGGGGSGGGGGRGGGSGSGKTNTTGSETATETMTLEDAAIQAIYDGITDPVLKAQFANYYDATMGNPMTKAITGDLNSLVAKAVTAAKPMTTAGGYANRFKNQQVGLAQSWLKNKVTPLEQLRQVSRGGGSGLTGTPTVAKKVSTTGKIAAPKTYTPPRVN